MIELIKNKARNFKNYKTFREFVKEHDSTTKSKLIEFKDWKFTDEGLRIKKKIYPMRDSGMKTLLKTFSMPTKFYYDKSPTDMLIKDINRMKREYTPDSTIMVHLQNNEVRAVSKPNAKSVKFGELLQAATISKKAFRSANWTDYGLRISLSEQNNQIKVTKNDIVDIGTELMYSDVGSFSTSGCPFLLRLVCTNGMVVKEKSPLLNSFSMSVFSEVPDEIYLGKLKTNLEMVTTDAKRLQKTFKVMKDNPINSLRTGELQMKKIRSAIGPEKFDEHEKLSIKRMIDEKERRAINVDLELYTVVDIITRMAKEYDFFGRRKIEGLAGSLILMSENELLS